jgi:hypothetical protein
MAIITIAAANLDRIQAGDRIVAVDGRSLRTPRAVATGLAAVAPGVRGIRLESPNPASTVEWYLYPGNVDAVTVERDAKTYRTAAAAAKAWGKAHGMVNRGGSLYWDTDDAAQARTLAIAAGLRSKALMGREFLTRNPVATGFMVKGYQRPFTGASSYGHTTPTTHYTKGWEALAAHLASKGVLLTDTNGRYTTKGQDA